MNIPPLVHCPEDGITCPLDGRQFSTFIQFFYHCRRNHSTVMEQEADVLACRQLGKELARLHSRNVETAAIAAKLPKRKGKL